MELINPIRVIRLEHVLNGTGPYQNYHTVNGNSTEERPSPYMDGLKWLDINPERHFGFENMKHVRRWFDRKFREEILSFSPYYEFVVYEVSGYEVAFGYHQLVFDKRFANRIGSVPLSVKFPKEQLEELLNR